MSALFAIAGSKFFIGSRVARKTLVTAADFAGMTFTEVSDWTQSGPLGATHNIIEQPTISSGSTGKLKGVKNPGTMENTFLLNPTDPGQILMKAATLDCNPFAFKIEWGAGCIPTAPVTISQATPGVVTLTAHGFIAGQAVTFSTTGALPTGLTAGTVYYVRSAGLTANEFTVSATPGGAAVNTTAAGTGTHSVTAQPPEQTSLFYSLVANGIRQGGDANAAQLRAWSLPIVSNVIEI